MGVRDLEKVKGRTCERPRAGASMKRGVRHQALDHTRWKTR